jgi:hypothetical protein
MRVSWPTELWQFTIEKSPTWAFSDRMEYGRRMQPVPSTEVSDLITDGCTKEAALQFREVRLETICFLVSGLAMEKTTSSSGWGKKSSIEPKEVNERPAADM